ncbi:transporter substrate-binding domain-containing protein [Sulfurimonas sp. MAG313]|nr:transporter substrate-binding domain-containing protein [Sulfurimonas sp. MAG313]MDF1881622.1 transporter substrate-binding domain-containing protein [Sulfurimonas sp. MAG313]
MTLQAIFEEAQIPLEIELLPIKRSLLNASSGITDGDAARILGVNEYFPSLYAVKPAIYEMNVIALSYKQFIPKDFSDLEKYNVGLVRGMKVLEVTMDKLHCKSLIKVDSHEQLIALLAKNRIDIALVDKEASFLLLNYYHKKGIFFRETTLMIESTYLHLHRKNISLIPKLNKAIHDLKKRGVLAEIKKEFYKELENRDISLDKLREEKLWLK